MSEEIKLLSDDELEGAFTGDAYQLYIQGIMKYPNLVKEEQQELARLYRDYHDLEAKQRLLETNLKYVVSIAKNYAPKMNHLQILDIIQEGNLALIGAIEEYNPETEVSFTTYATKWIRGKIMDAIYHKESEIRIPPKTRAAMKKYNSIKEQCNRLGKVLPNDDELCEILEISKEILDIIKTSSNLKPISMSQSINSDEEKEELVDFIPDKNQVYDDKLNQMATDDLYIVLKEVLTPVQYFIIYYHILLEEPKTIKEIASGLGMSEPWVKIKAKEAKEKLKPYMKNDSRLFSTTLSKIKKREGRKYDLLKKTPISPIDIINYLYVKDELNESERKLCELKLLGKYTYNNHDYAKILGKTIEELNQFLASLEEKVRKKFNDKGAYLQFQKLMLSYGVSIFDINMQEEKGIDYRALEEKYSSLSLNEILNFFEETNYHLTNDEKKLLDRYFDHWTGHIASCSEIEKEVNTVKFGFKYANNSLPYKALYDEYVRTKDEFTDEQQLYLESYVFGKKNCKIFKETYPESSIPKNRRRLIYRLEKSYYHVNRYFGNNFTRKEWIEVKEKYSDRFTPEKIGLMDLYLGVAGREYSRVELANMYNKSRIEINALIQPALELAINLYNGNGRRIEIDKELYIPYVLNPQIEFEPVTREILKLYLIENKSYYEISDIVKSLTGKELKTTKISDIITGALRKIDNHRFGLVQDFFITKSELSDFFDQSTIQWLDNEKEIVKLHFLEFIGNQKIADIKKLTVSEVNQIIGRFKSAYVIYKIKDVSLTVEEIKKEIELHRTESVISDKEKEIASFTYGIKSIWNSEGVTLTKKEIVEKFGISSKYYKNLLTRIKYALKRRKIGLLQPEFGFIPRSELDSLLNDVHLPIDETAREIICHLFELKGFPYMTFKDLSLKYNENVSSVREKYRRAIVSIYKYLNHEIDGTIDYESDIVPLMKYFGISDRMKIEDYFKNELTNEEMAKKYEVTASQMSRIMTRIRNSIYDITNNPDAKKFDFDYYLEVKNNPDLPFYEDLNLTIQVFDLAFGMSGEERLEVPEIIEKLNLNFDPSTLNKTIVTLMISCCKLKDGIKKINYFSYEDICEYYINNSNSMNSSHKAYYENYFKRANRKEVNGTSGKISYFILTDLIIAHYPDAFVLANATREEVFNILNKYGKQISKRVRKSLMRYFDIQERELMNGKDINHVFRLLNVLDMKRKELDPMSLNY